MTCNEWISTLETFLKHQMALASMAEQTLIARSQPSFVIDGFLLSVQDHPELGLESFYALRNAMRTAQDHPSKYFIWCVIDAALKEDGGGGPRQNTTSSTDVNFSLPIAFRNELLKQLPHMVSHELPFSSLFSQQSTTATTTKSEKEMEEAGKKEALGFSSTYLLLYCDLLRSWSEEGRMLSIPTEVIVSVEDYLRFALRLTCTSSSSSTSSAVRSKRLRDEEGKRLVQREAISSVLKDIMGGGQGVGTSGSGREEGVKGSSKMMYPLTLTQEEKTESVQKTTQFIEQLTLAERLATCCSNCSAHFSTKQERNIHNRSHFDYRLVPQVRLHFATKEEFIRHDAQHASGETLKTLCTLQELNQRGGSQVRVKGSFGQQLQEKGESED